MKNLTLKEKIKNFGVADIEDFSGKDEKVTFFTGLQNLQVLKTLFTFLKLHIRRTANTAL